MPPIRRLIASQFLLKPILGLHSPDVYHSDAPFAISYSFEDMFTPENVILDCDLYKRAYLWSVIFTKLHIFGVLPLQNCISRVRVTSVTQNKDKDLFWVIGRVENE